MKQSDIASLIIIVSISAILAFFVANSFIVPDESTAAEVEVLTELESEFSTVPADIFNKDAINPAENIEVTEFDTDKIFSDSE